MLTYGTLLRLCESRDMLRETDLSLAEVAAACGMSKFHFIRQFRAVFGATPNQYRIGWRIETAKRMLVSGGDSVTEICMALGYSSLGSFSALFCRQTGQAPSAYRQRLKDRTERLEPHCMSLFEASWSRNEQLSRSDDDSTQVSRRLERERNAK